MVNYRGSWGSPGAFGFAHAVEDASAVLAFLRDTANVRSLAVDTSRMVLAGHSMGGWVTAMAASRDSRLRGAILISAVNLGREGLRGATARAQVVEGMRGRMESLTGVTAEGMADEVITHADAFDWDHAIPGLARLPLLVITADDGLAPEATALADSVRARGDTRVTVVHVATDHSWSGTRIDLEAELLRWLERLSD